MAYQGRKEYITNRALSRLQRFRHPAAVTYSRMQFVVMWPTLESVERKDSTHDQITPHPGSWRRNLHKQKLLKTAEYHDHQSQYPLQ